MTLLYLSLQSLIIKHNSPLYYDETITALEAAITNKEYWKVSQTSDLQKSIHEG
jgi:hypothetical protein